MQGVGFRPYVYRLAGELGLAGFVLNDARGVLLEVEGDDDGGRPVPGPARPRGAAAGVDRARGGRGPRADRAPRLPDRREPAGGVPDAPVTPDSGDLRGLPARAVRPGRPPLPLPVHQLHQLRAAVHDRPRGPVRPAAHDDGRASGCARAARPSTTTPPTAASTPSPTPARSAGRRCRWCGPTVPPSGRPATPTRCARPPWRCATARIVAVKGIGGYHLACRADDEAPWRRCGRASTARTSRSR